MEQDLKIINEWKVKNLGDIFIFGVKGCLDEDTFIDIVEGENIKKVKIKDLPNNFKVISYDFNSNRNEKKIKINKAEKFFSGEKEVYEIEFYNGKKVIATKNHKFFSMDGREVLLKDLRKYDKIFASNHPILNSNVSKRVDVKEKMRVGMIGKNNGKIRSKDHIRKLREGHKKYSENIPLEIRNKLKENQWTKGLSKEEMLKHYKNKSTAFNKGVQIWKNKVHPRGMLGKKHSKISKEQISISTKKRLNTFFVRKKLSKNAKLLWKRKGFKEKQSKLISKSLKGRKFSDEHRKKISESCKGRISPFIDKFHSQETKDKIRELSLGKKLSEETKRKIGIKSKENRKYQILPKKDTSIEIKIQNFLSQLQIEYFTHKYINIKHGYQCDIFIPSKNLVIECDGNYWHKYPTGNYIDHIRTKELIEKGFKILRLWEVEINNMTIDKFEEKIENAN